MADNDTTHDTAEEVDVRDESVSADPIPSDATVNIPDDLSDFQSSNWTEASYGDTITGSGAAKLASSAVAPLVAYARGYYSLLPDGVRDFVSKQWNKGTASAEGRQVTNAVGDRDALVMPWFTPDDVIEQSHADYDIMPSAIQYRPHPANVQADENGKKRKYVNVKGQSLVFDMHPATPSKMILGHMNNVLITEGLLKADSALTAYLLGNGITPADLALQVTDKTPSDARHRLTELMERIPQERRVVVVAIVGVGTWRQNPEWGRINVKDGQVLIAFDGDVASKPQVWKQANDMFDFVKKSKKATPMLVDLSEVPTEDGNKVGIDDYLASGGTWADLMRMVDEKLPPRPQGVDTTSGTVRMNPRDLWMEERTPGDPSMGVAGQWVRKTPYIGRIVSIDNRRAVTPKELQTGVYETTVSARDIISDCKVEIEWMDPDTNEPRKSIIEGPTSMLATNPDGWLSPRIKAAIHDDVLSLPTWPPRFDGWLEAMKGHRREDISRNAAWTHMGWVPRPQGGTPVFLVGKQVMGSTGFLDAVDAVCGVDEADLSGSSRFGVDLPEDKEQARADVRKILSTYRKCWTDSRHAAVVIAAGLRPVVPLPCHASLLFSGGTGGGKALPMDSVVITPEGTKRVEELKVGDHLVAPDGTPTRLRAMSPVWYDEDIFELTLSDGQKVRMSGNHVAKVSSHQSRKLHARREDSERMSKVRSLRHAAAKLNSGDSNSLKHIADGLGVTVGHLTNIVKAAGTPSDVRWVSSAARDGEFQTIGDFTFQRTVAGLDDFRGVKTRMYPVAEVLNAYADHLEFSLTRDETPKVFSRKVKEMAEDWNDKGYAVPVFDGLDLPEADLPVAPYTMGAWLGDGTSVYGIEVLDNIRADGYETDGHAPYYNVRGLHSALREAGVLGEKHIPVNYLRASREQRLALLQGLMDTDGTIDVDGGCELALSDARLAHDALDLIRSMGIKASMVTHPVSSVNSDGDRVECKDRYRIRFTTTIPVFRMARKAIRVPAEVRETAKWLYITKIEQVETVPSRCVQVEHPTGCFLSDGYVQSHNTFSSSALMGFWQAYPDAWNDRRLPGSANDTAASTEVAISKTPIWVMDDLAPSAANPQKQAEQQENVNKIIRSVHNGAGRRRMTAEMESQKDFTPRALLVVSAEAAPLNDQSIMNRLIHIEVAPGFLVPERQPTDALEELNRRTTTVSRVTGYALRMIAREIERKGWEKVYHEWEADQAEFSKDTARFIENSMNSKGEVTKRQSESISEMLLGLQVLRKLFEDLDLEDEFEELSEQMYEDIQKVAVEGFTENRRLDAGRTFTGRLASLLSSGRAHIGAAGAAGVPITVSDSISANQADFWNQKLGWSLSTDKDRPATPNGPLIGYIVYNEENVPVVFFDKDMAFAEVQRAYGKDGHNAKSMWDAVWRSNIAQEVPWKRRVYNSGKTGNTVRCRPNGHSIEGVPIPLEVLLSPNEND